MGSEPTWGQARVVLWSGRGRIETLAASSTPAKKLHSVRGTINISVCVLFRKLVGVRKYFVLGQSKNLNGMCFGAQLF